MTSDPMAQDWSEPEWSGADEGAFSSRAWLADHIGRLLGAIGGLLVLAVLIFFAALGFRPALFILVFFFSGLFLIIFGGKIHRA